MYLDRIANNVLLKADVKQHVCSKDRIVNRINTSVVFQFKSINNVKRSVDHHTLEYAYFVVSAQGNVL